MKTWYAAQSRYLRLVLEYYCKRIVINLNVHLMCTLMETIRGHLATCLATMYRIKSPYYYGDFIANEQPREAVRRQLIERCAIVPGVEKILNRCNIE